jgi:hypothetical protein
MKTITLICLACGLSACCGQSANAQYAYDPGIDVFNGLQSRNQQLQQQMDQTWQQYTNQYRQQTGDWSTPDPVLQQQVMNQYYAQNPQALQQQMNQQQQIRRRIFGNWNDSLAMRAGSWRQYNESSDRHQRQMQNYIRSQADYVNPETGQAWNLPYGEPGYYRSPCSDFYQNPAGQYYHYGPGGYWQELDEIR